MAPWVSVKMITPVMVPAAPWVWPAAAVTPTQPLGHGRGGGMVPWSTSSSLTVVVVVGARVDVVPADRRGVERLDDERCTPATSGRHGQDTDASRRTRCHGSPLEILGTDRIEEAPELPDQFVGYFGVVVLVLIRVPRDPFGLHQLVGHEQWRFRPATAIATASDGRLETTVREPWRSRCSSAK